MRNLDDDIELENYLRDFQPVAPRPLPSVRKHEHLYQPGPSYSPALSWCWRSSQSEIPGGRNRARARAATRAATVRRQRASRRAHRWKPKRWRLRQGDEALESALARSSKVALPRVDRPDTALNVLSGE